MDISERPPEATVVVCTRNRGHMITDTIRSVLGSDVAEFELLVIDQSDDDDTHHAITPFLVDPRVRYLRTTDTGVARSRSLALNQARSEYILNTDDDCVVAKGWIAANLKAFRDHPSAAIVFGDVVAPRLEGSYAPESVADADFTVGSIRDWRAPDGANVGIGASMSMRRSVLIELGGFDHELGPGARFRNAEDTDMSLRALLAGHGIVRTRLARVDHYGHRSHEAFRQLTRGAMFGLGAVSGKLVRRHPVAIAWFVGGLAWRLVVRVAIRDLGRLRKPPVLGRVVHFATGFWQGLRTPLDPANPRLFRADEREQPVSDTDVAGV